jgi:hypothetical protein
MNRRDWQSNPQVDKTLHRFWQLGDVYWSGEDNLPSREQIEEALGHRLPAEPAEGRNLLRSVHPTIWTELVRVVRALTEMGVPATHLMATRGELTRSNVDKLVQQARTPSAAQLADSWQVSALIAQVGSVLHDLEVDGHGDDAEQLRRLAKTFLHHWLHHTVPIDKPDHPGRWTPLPDELATLESGRWPEARRLVEKRIAEI